MELSSINGRTKLVGIIGWPVEHTLSPVMQNEAFKALGMNWRYLPFPTRPADLPDAIRGIRALGIKGVNLTIPHKEAVLPLLDELSPAARAIGAVNTVLVEPDGTLFGENTDALGFGEDLKAHGIDVAGKNALVLGAGGAARAVVYTLLEMGASVCVLNRSVDRAEMLAKEMAGKTSGEACAGRLDEIPQKAGWAYLVVNTTPVGMWPAVDASPWPEEVRFKPGQVAYDVIYRPQETLFMAHARKCGAKAVGGIGMLVRQGAAAFRLWTGKEPPLAVMEAAVKMSWGNE